MNKDKYIYIVACILLISIGVCIFTTLRLSGKYDDMEQKVATVDDRFSEIVTQQDTLLDMQRSWAAPLKKGSPGSQTSGDAHTRDEGGDGGKWEKDDMVVFS